MELSCSICPGDILIIVCFVRFMWQVENVQILTTSGTVIERGRSYSCWDGFLRLSGFVDKAAGQNVFLEN